MSEHSHEDDPLETFRATTRLITEQQAALDRTAATRARAVAALYARGYTYKDLGSVLGLSAPRIGQLIGATRQEPVISSGEPAAEDERQSARGGADADTPADIDRARELAGLLDRIQSDPGGKLDRILEELAAIRGTLNARSLGALIDGTTIGELGEALGMLTEAQRDHLRRALEAADDAKADEWYYSQPDDA